MKKKLALVLAVAMCCSFLFGCGSKKDPASSGGSAANALAGAKETATATTSPTSAAKATTKSAATVFLRFMGSPSLEPNVRGVRHVKRIEHIGL